MAKERTIDQELKTLKTKVQEGKAVIGKDRVLKALKTKELKKVFLASNCPANLKQDVQHYSTLAQVPVVKVGISNEELGVLCKKNYFISVIGLIEE